METQIFVVRLIGPRPTFMADMTDAEKALMAAHVDYWKPMIIAGEVVAFGPVLYEKGPWGLAVLQLESREMAEAYMENDPTIKAGVGFTYELAPMKLGFVRSRK